ncbi:MAG: chemotaxis protein CheX, partial [Anaerolineaceae bacterium]|nr:chemotaxis protein CheX [Anaerolineaceae bacterium]
IYFNRTYTIACKWFVGVIAESEGNEMNIQYLVPFIEAAYEVLKAEAKFEMKRGKLSLTKGPYITDEVTVIISLIGDVVGTVFYGMNSQTALQIISIILGERLDEVDALAQSGIAELGNVITGRASVKLSKSGLESTISPPTLMIGKGAMISTLDLPRLIVPLQGEPGQMIIHLALIESRKSGLSPAQLQVPQAPEILKPPSENP